VAESYVQLWRALNWPNRISLLRVLGVAPFMLLLLNQRAWPAGRQVAMGIFVAMSLSDAADGYLARRRGQATQLGAFLDPLADKLLITCAALLLASSWACVPGARLPNWVVVAVVGKDLWVVTGFLVVFLVTGQVRIQPVRVGKLCTAVQLAMVAGVLASPEINALGHQAGTKLATGLGWAVLVLCVLSVAAYTRLGVAFLAEAGSPVGTKAADGANPLASAPKDSNEVKEG